MAYSSDIPGNSVGKALKKYFEQKGYSQQQIADILDVHQTNVSALFLGKRPFGKNVAKKWNNAFGFRINWLMTGEGPMFDTKSAGMQIRMLEEKEDGYLAHSRSESTTIKKHSSYRPL